MSERVLLVGVTEKGAKPDSSLEELHRLAETAGGEVRGLILQNIARPNPATYVGAGKVEQIAEAARREDVRAVIFNEDLSPAQQRNLEETIPAKIIDRTRLILDIFAGRARTREGRLQVELAQLEYMLPRLTGKGVSFSQQVGGIGTRGPGERKLEYERRRIRDRISRLRRDIEGIRREREVQRKGRSDLPFPTAALIGYTNAGKSTLLNALTGAEVYADDRLFATLDPTTRRARLPSGGWVLVTDTVGFIQKLPTFLVAAFRATLEEAAHADCIVHVTDASDPRRAEHERAVRAVLDQLGAGKVPEVAVASKTDLLPASALEGLKDREEVAVSARSGQGLRELMERIEKVLSRRWVKRTLVLGPKDAGLLGEAHRLAQVTSRRPTDEGGWELDLRVTPENYARLRHRLRGA